MDTSTGESTFHHTNAVLQDPQNLKDLCEPGGSKTPEVFPKEEYPKYACIILGPPLKRKRLIYKKLERFLLWEFYCVKKFSPDMYNLNSEHPHNEDARYQILIKDMLSWFKATPKGPAPLCRTRSAGSLRDDNPDILRPKEAILPCMQDRPRVCLYDGGGMTHEARLLLYGGLRKEGVRVLFLEVLENLSGDDGDNPSGFNPTHLGKSDSCEPAPEAKPFELEDNYTRTNEGHQEDIPLIKYIDDGRRMISNNVKGDDFTKIINYLMALTPEPVEFYICRHGESLSNIQGIIGGNPALSPKGTSFALNLERYFRDKLEHENKNLVVWTSTLKRTHQTVISLPGQKIKWSELDELESGILEGLSCTEIRRDHPSEYSKREMDKFCYKYPAGEGYRDLMKRTRKMLLELEAHQNTQELLLIVAHQAIMRVINAYFDNTPPHEIPYVETPLHTLVKVKFDADPCELERKNLGEPLKEPATDTGGDEPKRFRRATTGNTARLMRVNNRQHSSRGKTGVTYP